MDTKHPDRNGTMIILWGKKQVDFYERRKEYALPEM
jgi:hypothetical protein